MARQGGEMDKMENAGAFFATQVQVPEELFWLCGAKTVEEKNAAIRGRNSVAAQFGGKLWEEISSEEKSEGE